MKHKSYFIIARIFYGLLLIMLVGASWGTDGAWAAESGTQAWLYPTLSYRREIQLPPDSAKARTNIPIFIDLKPFGPVDLTTIKVDEVTGATPLACKIAAYSQPSGRDPRVFWTATGTTAAGQTRRFLLYYNKAAKQAPYVYNWSRSGSTFGEKTMTTANVKSLGVERFFHTLKGDRLELLRGAKNPLDVLGDYQKATFYETSVPDIDFFHVKDLKNNLSPLNGLRVNYAFLGEQFTQSLGFDMTNPFEALLFDRNGPTTAMSARYHMTQQIAHKLEVSHRLFQGLPIMEYSFTATADSLEKLKFTSDIYSARQFCWGSSFVPIKMVNDMTNIMDTTQNALNSNNNVKTWQILYDANDNAFGVFTFKPSHKNYSTLSRLREEYDLASEAASLYIYCAVGKRPELLPLFETMKRGFPLGPEQRQLFDIVQPLQGNHILPSENLNVVVAGPKVGSDLALSVKYPDGSTKTYKPASTPTSSNTFNLGTIASTAKFGTWTLTATSGGVSRAITVDVLNPVHPCVLFTPAELKTMQDRWKTDSRYQTHVKATLLSKVQAAYSTPPLPVNLTVEPRAYGRNLQFYAALLLMDPTLQQYRTRMWADFETMINWKNWDPIGTGATMFNNDHVVRGELLQALAFVYDCFYSDLTPANRRRYAELLAKYADLEITLNYIPTDPPRWQNSNALTNNGTMIHNASVAGVDRAVRAELPEARHAPWTEKLEANFANIIKALPADGSHTGGAAYNTLAMVSFFYWTETRRLNGDTGVYTKSPWFNGVVDYLLYGTFPGRVGNFGGLISFGNGDPTPFTSFEGLSGFLGNRCASKIGQWITENINYNVVGYYQDYWQVYGRPKTDPATLPNWHYFPDHGLFVFRSSWNNDAMYVAVKCGPMYGGHDHPDAGTFIIHRNGFPYIAAPQYLNLILPHDENILIANGKVLRGAPVGDFYSFAVDPQYWGTTDRALGSPDYFNVLANPKPAYEDGSNLTSYTREFVGFDDLVILRDQAAASAASSFELQFHAYRSDVQTVADQCYNQYQYPTEQVFQQISSDNVRLYPNMQDAPAEWMTILNLSKTGFTTTIDPWKLVTEYIPKYIPLGTTGSRSRNLSKTTLQRGYQLTRKVSGTTSMGALQVFHFRSDQYKGRKWDSVLADAGLVIYYGSAAADTRIKVVWPRNKDMKNVTGSEGLTVKGAMAMRNYENKEYGGRDLTYLRDDSAKGEKADLVNASAPVTITSKFASGGREAWIITTQATTLTLYHPQAISQATFDNKPVVFKVTGTQKTFSLPASPSGGHLVTAYQTNAIKSNSDPEWMSYR